MGFVSFRNIKRVGTKPDLPPHLASCPLRPESGFTLIELMVVLVIIGIALAMVTLQLMPDNRAALRQESDKLALLLENAQLQAQASGRPLAWSGAASHYYFWKKDDYNDWMRIEDDPLFRPRDLPDGIQIGQLRVEEILLKPGDKLLLNANSIPLPYTIGIGNQYGNMRIVGKSTGEVATESGEAHVQP